MLVNACKDHLSPLHLPTAQVGFTRQKKERKNHASCVLVICCLTHIINSKIIEDEAIDWLRTSSCWL